MGGKAARSVPKNLTCDLWASSQVKGLRDREGAKKQEKQKGGEQEGQRLLTQEGGKTWVREGIFR